VADTSTAALVLRLVLSLGIVLALVGAVTWALRRKGLLRTGPVGGRGGRLEVLDRRPLNRHASIVLARVGGTAVLLGVTEQRVEVLSTAEGLDAAWRELPEADATPAPGPAIPAAPVEPAAAPVPGTRRTGFPVVASATTPPARMSFVEALRELTVRRS
jgi:flagellar biosynthetic protein FliO